MQSVNHNWREGDTRSATPVPKQWLKYISQMLKTVKSFTSSFLIVLLQILVPWNYVLLLQNHAACLWVPSNVVILFYIVTLHTMLHALHHNYMYHVHDMPAPANQDAI